MERPVRILIVDDEPDILEFLRYNFLKKGLEVTTASNGGEGIEAAQICDPDVVISDILMPVMDGIQMCRAMRKEEKMKNTPFIFLTAVTDDYKVLFAMSSGADQFVSKPVKFETLLSLVNEVISTKKAS